MSVWNDEHPRPSGGVEHERGLLEWMTTDAKAQLAALAPHDAESWSKYRHTVGGAIDVIVDRQLPKAASIEAVQRAARDLGQWQELSVLIRNAPEQEELPAVILRPKTWNRRTVVWLDERGKASLYGDDDQPVAAARRLLASGAAIIAPDLLYQGEFLAAGQSLAASKIPASSSALRSATTTPFAPNGRTTSSRSSPGCAMAKRSDPTRCSCSRLREPPLGLQPRCLRRMARSTAPRSILGAFASPT
jgi:hypothetical protein